MSGTDDPHNAGLNIEHPDQDPTLSSVVPDRTAAFCCLGFQVRVETNDSRIIDAAGDAFGPPIPASDGGQDDGSHYTVRLLVHDVSEDPGWQPVQPLIREQCGYFTITSSRATAVTVDCARRFAFGFLSHQAANSREFLRTAILQSTAFSLVSSQTLAAVHAAVLWKGGTTVILRGASNAGKSTLAYAAIQAGYAMIAEDVAFVRSGDDGLELHGVPWSMYLKPDAIRFFPELADETPVERFNREQKIRVDLRIWFPGQAKQSAGPGPVVFVEHWDHEECQLLRLGSDESRQLMEETAIAAEQRGDAEAKLWETLLRFPAYRMIVGNDLEQAARMLDLVVAAGRSH